MSNRLNVFYLPEMAVPNNPSISPSAMKPELVANRWGLNYADYLQFRSFDPLGSMELAAAHDLEYVHAVLNCDVNNGFDNKLLSVATSLPYTSGSMVAAAVHVMTEQRERRKVAVSPTSGFHHAGYDFGGGFCTFNGLMVAAQAVLAMGLAKDILILDCDAHYGNGTADIIQHLGLGRKVRHISRYSADSMGGTYVDFSDLMQKLSKLWFEATREPDLVLYQAGADAHIDDPLGAGYLTTEEMRMRDRKVFDWCHHRDIPLVWNLAGGYQRDDDGGIEPVLRLHDQTLQQCLEAYGFASPWPR